MLNFNDIEAAARSRTLDCLLWLLPDGRLHGDEFCALNPTRHDHKTGSFAYNIRKHVWSDFASNDKGRGIIDLWHYVRNQPFKDAACDLARWLGLDGECGSHDFARRVYQKQTAKVSKVAKHEKWIAQLWQQSISVQGTLAEKYLQSRGIFCAIPQTIRFLSAHKHSDSGLMLPVMLAAVTAWPSKNIIALHRTYLLPDGSGKAAVSPNKKMIGHVAGGAVRLSPSAESMAVGEGIETCLAAQWGSHVPTWAALSTSGLMNLVLPALPLGREIIIAADNDVAGMSAAQKSAERWIGEGRKVRLATPNTAKDFNDLLRMP
jgi:hypothetical protein